MTLVKSASDYTREKNLLSVYGRRGEDPRGKRKNRNTTAEKTQELRILRRLEIGVVVQLERSPALCFWRSWPEHTDPKTQSTNHPELRQATDPQQGHFTERLNVLQGTQTNVCMEGI